MHFQFELKKKGKWKKIEIGKRIFFESFPLPPALQDIFDDIWQYLTRVINEQTDGHLVRSSKRGALRLRRPGRIWIVVEAWNIFTSDWKNGRNADEEGFIFDKMYIYIYIRACTRLFLERIHRRLVEESRALDRINQNLSNLVKFLELFLGEIESILEIHIVPLSDKKEQRIKYYFS